MCSHFIELCPAGPGCKCALNLPPELQPWSTDKDPLKVESDAEERTSSATSETPLQ